MPPPSTIVVNNIVKELCSIEHVYPSEAIDRAVITNFLLAQSDTSSHGNHWIYYQTACRRLWLNYFDGDTLIPITARFRESPSFVIVRPVGTYVAEKCALLADRITALSNHTLIVKNIDFRVRNELHALGFSDYRPHDGWSQAYRYDDQTFPEAVVDLPELISLKGPRYAHLRHDLHRGFLNSLVIEPYCASQHVTHILQLIGKWARAFLKRYPHEDVPDLAEFYTTFVRGNEGLAFGRDYLAWVFRLDNHTVGFTYGAPKPGDAVDMYANPCFFDQNYASEAVLYAALREAKNLGYRSANLGGSETLGLHRFKQKFVPSVELSRYHAVYYHGNHDP